MVKSRSSRQRNTEHFLSLIVPAYKQEQTIIDNLLEIQAVLDQIRYDYEIIVVVDGMVDQTFQKIEQKKLAKTTCIAYKQNHGKSYAIRLGMSKAKGDYVMFIDSGMEIDPNGISMLMEHMEWYDADIIVGSKRHPASVIKYSTLRKILSYGYYYFVRLFFGLNVRDTQAGIKIYKKKVLEKVLPRLVEKKFAGDLEILVVSRSLGFRRIYEAPIKLNYELSGVTSAATFKAITGIFIDTLAIFYRKNILHFYNRTPRIIPFTDTLYVYHSKDTES
ncbi:glycosyltransferase [Patescibacteria group bacterium]|nr:glycosyltransferase [Patescibacteria group bacterium]